MDETPTVSAGARSEHLFVVRVWREPGRAGEGQWRGSVDHVASGRRHYFANLGDLTEFMMTRLEETSVT